MSYVLILMIYWGSSVAVSQQVYANQAACEAAGQAAKKATEDAGLYGGVSWPVYVCSPVLK